MKKRTQKQISLLVALVAMVLLAVAQWVYAGHTLGDDRLIVWFFDVGQGDAIYIESPTGYQMLIDGGPGDAVLSKLSSVVPFWDQSIDAVLLTHPHADHLDGLVEVVDQYTVDAVYLTHVDYYTPALPEFERRVSDDEQIVEVTRPMMIDLGGGARMDIIFPIHSLVNQRIDDVNDSSIVALLTYGGTTVLLTGDATALEEPQIAESIDGEVDVLKVGHHGSRYSSSSAFLKDIDPEVAIISCGRDNSYGHPHQETLERLRAIGATILRTDTMGDIRLTSDGNEPELVSLPL